MFTILILVLVVAYFAAKRDDDDRARRLESARPDLAEPVKLIPPMRGTVVYDKAKGIGVPPPEPEWDPTPIRVWNNQFIGALARKHGYILHGKRHPPEVSDETDQGDR